MRKDSPGICFFASGLVFIALYAVFTYLETLIRIGISPLETLATIYLLLAVLFGFGGYYIFVLKEIFTEKIDKGIGSMIMLVSLLNFFEAINLYSGAFKEFLVVHTLAMLSNTLLMVLFLYKFYMSREKISLVFILGPLIALYGSIYGIKYVRGFLILGIGWIIVGSGVRQISLKITGLWKKLPLCHSLADLSMMKDRCFIYPNLKRYAYIFGAIAIFAAYQMLNFELIILSIYLIWKIRKPRFVHSRMITSTRSKILYIIAYIAGFTIWLFEGSAFTLIGILTFEEYIASLGISMIIMLFPMILRLFKGGYLIEALLYGLGGIILVNPVAYISVWALFILVTIEADKKSIQAWKYILRNAFININELYYDPKMVFKPNLAENVNLSRKDLRNFILMLKNFGLEVLIFSMTGEEISVREISPKELIKIEISYVKISIPQINEIIRKVEEKQIFIIPTGMAKKTLGVDELILDIFVARGVKEIMIIDNYYVIIPESEREFILKQKPTIETLAKRWNINNTAAEKILSKIRELYGDNVNESQ